MTTASDRADEDVLEDDEIEQGQEEAGEKSAEEKDIEARARAMGWFPEEEWDEERAKRTGRKKPARFLSPADYIERTNDNLPILRETTRRLSEEIAGVREENKEAKTKLDDIGKLVKSLYQQNKVIGQREYERGKAEAEKIRKQAIADGDVDAVDRADETLRSLEQIKPEAEAEPARVEPRQEERRQPEERTEPDRTKLKPAVRAWVEANPWFEKDPVLNVFVIEEHGKLIKDNPGVDEAELLDDAKKAAVDRFPEKFNINPRRGAPGSVARPGPGGERRNGKKTFRELDPTTRDDYRRQAEYMKEHGITWTEQEFMDGLEKFGAA